MKPGDENSTSRPFARLSTGTTLAGVVVMLLISFLWFDSYFTGRKHYRSVWRKSDTITTERANWLFSNYGSFGFAWRQQEISAPEFTPPEDERESSTFGASRSQLGHIHPSGLRQWHWIDFSPSTRIVSGPTRHHYGHLFIPYWIPFLLFLVLVISVNTKSDRGANRAPPSNPRNLGIEPRGNGE